MPWKMLLENRLKEGALHALQAILDDLPSLDGEFGADPTLASGLAGRAILHGYLALAEYGPRHVDAAVRCLENAIAATSEKPMEASLYSGLTGVGWALGHLRGRVPGLDAADECAEIDEVLLQHLEQSPWRGDYDLISGLVGFGVYALERLPRPVAGACLERVVDGLAETAERRREGITWWTNPAWLPEEGREKSPNGYYNLGLAHGVPGVIALLALASAKGIARAKAGVLLEGAVDWLLAHQAPGGFAHWVEPERTNGSARLAWCYGDPGVAVALSSAARCVSNSAWEREALGIARRAACRPPEQAGVRDAGLCHGAAGLGHLFNRAYQATGETEFADAARFWFERTLAMRRPGHGIGGYQAWQLSDDGKPTWVTDAGLLTGSTGIALALLAATTEVEPAWDRMLLTDIPPATLAANGVQA